MLTEICQYLRNWFVKEKIFGWFSIENGVLLASDGTALPLLSGQYFRIIGSFFNDGVHQYQPPSETPVQAITEGEGEDSESEPESEPQDVLVDEPSFAGAVWLMAVPPDFLTLAKEIENWQKKYGDVDNPNMSPFASESFGGYSYNKAQGYAGSGGGMLTSWDSVFVNRLAPWRKI